jgi:long-chain acyl-CoA synthetase
LTPKALEASGASTMQTSDESPVGTVGVPYPGIEVRLADEGEIQIKGDVVFQGCFKNPGATREAIDAEGWLHTGDIARWDSSGPSPELRIIDRKKGMMITSGGKNITPSEIENALRFSPFVKQAIIIADRLHYVPALIQTDFESVSNWAEKQGLIHTNYCSLTAFDQVRKLVDREVSAINAKMPQVQQVRKFHLLAKEVDDDRPEESSPGYS